jgi:hypothetical protein
MKLVIAILTLIFLGHQSEAQRQLKITREKMETRNPYSGAWLGWPNDYSYFQAGSEPVLELTNLDNNGSFLVSSLINGQIDHLTVRYSGYDATNNWYRYVDSDGNSVCVLGATMSYLAQYGWPSNAVQIYFWDYSQNMAVVFE